MKKLYNIKGHWIMDDSKEFNEEDMWYGQLLLEDDGWFEGIVVDKSSEDKDRFVFGVYGPDKGIELHKLVPLDLSAPIIFHGLNSEKGYEGTFDAIGLFGPISLGKSVLNTEESFSETYDEDVKKLEERIAKWKETTLALSAQDLYENSVKMRRVICMITLGNYDGRKYTYREMNAIMEECKPVYDDVVEKTAKDIAEEASKTLGLEFGDNPADLPFEI